MGEFTSFKIVDKNGALRRPEAGEQFDSLGETDRLELEYAYGPDLLPAGTWSGNGMWRYLELLPTWNDILYPLTVGGTPLLAPPQLRQHMGLPRLWLKDETRSPTGSTKDRATALVLEHALHQGIRTVSCASTGNIALSLALGSAACGLEAVLFVPADVMDTKLHYMQMANATIFKVKEGYEAAVRLSREAARIFSWYDRNTGYNPLTLEAKKTVAFEIWDQLEHRVPDAVVVPVGDGVTLNGIAKGFRELMLCGATTRIPRLIGIQAEQCQPLKRVWEGSADSSAYSGKTIADGIAVSSPINAVLALRDVFESRGCFVAVSDEALLQAITLLAATSGILAEPAGAAALAGTHIALAQGFIQKQETIVILVTGSGLKTPQHFHPQQARSVYEVSSDIEEVKQIRMKRF